MSDEERSKVLLRPPGLLNSASRRTASAVMHLPKDLYDPLAQARLLPLTTEVIDASAFANTDQEGLEGASLFPAVGHL